MTVFPPTTLITAVKEKGAWGERLILGAPRECRVILGTALGIRHPCVQLSNRAPRAS